jgi:hypothetical protein
MWKVSRGPKSLRSSVSGGWQAAFVCAVALLAPACSLATTVTLDFDTPDFAPGQVVQDISQIHFAGGAVVFHPTSVATFTGNQALKRSVICSDPTCANGAYRMVIRFGASLPYPPGALLPIGADSVSMRVGVDSISSTCFPEGTTCPVYARLVGYDRSGVPVASTPDVLLLDSSALTKTGSFTTPITREMKIVDPNARIVSVAIVYGRDTFSHDPVSFTGEPQIDHLVVDFPDQPPNPGNAPPVPTVAITAPLSGTTLSYPYNVQLNGSVTAPGGLAAFCYTLNALPPAQAADCSNGADLRPDDSFQIPLDNARLAAGANTASVTVFDTWGQRTSKTVSFTTNAPPPPVVAIVEPKASDWLNPSGPISVSGQVFTIGPLAGFCVVANATATPNQPACQQLSAVPYLGVTPLGFSVPPQGQLHRGANSVTAFAYDRWGHLGQAKVSFNTPADFRVMAMEITQAIQVPDLPLNVTGSAPYAGVRLRAAVPTVVRVFADTPDEGSFCCASARLSGFVLDLHGNEVPLGELFPDSSPPALSTGGVTVPLAMRADPAGGYVFTLPTDWTTQGRLRLKATLMADYPLIECSGCTANNSFSVTGIDFEQPVALGINPVALTRKDASGMTVAPPPPASIFAPALAISPVASATVAPYVATIDVSDLADTSGNCRHMNGTCEPLVWGRVALVEENHRDGYTIGVGPLDVGVEFLAPYFRAFGWIDLEPIAVSDSRELLLSAAHELYHEIGFFHAGPMCPSANLWVNWPPDQMGFIHGVGLDRRKKPGAGGVWNGRYEILAPGVVDSSGQTIQYFDLMSYCVHDDSLAWISVDNWNRYGGMFPNGALPDSVAGHNPGPSSDTTPVATQQQAVTADGGSLRLLAVLDKDKVVAFRVDHADGHLLAHPPKTDYVFVVRDGKKRVLARVPAIIIPPSGHGPAGTGLVALVPARNADLIEVEHDGGIIGAKQRSPSAPTIDLIGPEQGAAVSRGEQVGVRWNAKDADGDKLEVRIEYSPGPDKPFQVVFVGPDRGAWTVPGYQLSASPRGRLRVVASDGFNETASREAQVRVAPSAPRVDIIEPQARTSFPASTPIRLRAAAFGDGLAPLPGKQLAWSLDGAPAGRGAEIEVRNLNPGAHTARVTARDGALSSSREIGFTVLAPSRPSFKVENLKR